MGALAIWAVAGFVAALLTTPRARAGAQTIGGAA